jgi:hypothetical protein
MPQGSSPIFAGKRNMDTIRDDVLCAFLVLRELNEYGQHYNERARIEIVEKALAALRNVWTDTGADPAEMEPRMMELMKAGQICRGRPKKVATG